ncbi:MAG: DUF4268 domain-containing protein [Prevotella sp.]|jgi:hypothetical protein|nr:DUF4268 domain-containing protein [Prevotella sp.]
MNTNDLYPLFWPRFIERFEKESTDCVFQSSNKDRYWLSAPSNFRGITYQVAVTGDNKRFAQVAIYISASGDRNYNKDVFDRLHRRKDEIENEIGFKLQWQRKDLQNSAAVVFQKHDTSITNKDEWDETIAFLCEHMQKFTCVFDKYLKEVMKELGYCEHNCFHVEEVEMSVTDEIRKLKELLDEGAITQEEYDRQKSILHLSDTSETPTSPAQPDASQNEAETVHVKPASLPTSSTPMNYEELARKRRLGEISFDEYVKIKEYLDSEKEREQASAYLATNVKTIKTLLIVVVICMILSVIGAIGTWVSTASFVATLQDLYSYEEDDSDY